MGANYKSVLATARSTARQLVREALERYGVTQPNAEDAYVLCDVVGSVHGMDSSWQAQYLRAVGDAERPLVLQDVWKPKTGCTRRFEIRRRCDVERMVEGEDEDGNGECSSSTLVSFFFFLLHRFMSCTNFSDLCFLFFEGIHTSGP